MSQPPQPPARPPPKPGARIRGCVPRSGGRPCRYPFYVANSTYLRDGLTHVASSVVPFCFLVYVPRSNKNSTSQFEKFHHADNKWRPPTPIKSTHSRHARREYLLSNLTTDRTELFQPPKRQRHPRLPLSFSPPRDVPVGLIPPPPEDLPVLIRDRMRYFSLCLGCHLRIGRSFDNDIVISQRHVSRWHCCIWVGRSRRRDRQTKGRIQLLGEETLGEMGTGESSSSSDGEGSVADGGSRDSQKRKAHRRRERRRRKRESKASASASASASCSTSRSHGESQKSEFRGFLDQFDVGLYVHGHTATNGTRVNQKDIGEFEARLCDGDCVTLCGHDFYVCMGPKSLYRTLKAVKDGRRIGGVSGGSTSSSTSSSDRKRKKKKRKLKRERERRRAMVSDEDDDDVDDGDYRVSQSSVVSVVEDEEDERDEEELVPSRPILRSVTRRAKKTAVYFDQRMGLHYDHLKSHPECPLRISTIQQEMTREGILDRCLVLSDREATTEELLLCHTQAHIDEVLSPQIFSKNDYYKCNDTPIAAKLAVGGVIDIVERVCRGEIENGFAMIRPPGHHATRDQFKGFCFFNNVGVAARVAATKFGKRVAIVDWDVHHGNGTQEIFEKDPTILYFSTHRHGFDFYPGTGSVHETGTGPGDGFCVNVAFGSPYGDADQLGSFLQILLPILYDFQPDLIIVSAGFDAVVGDPLGACVVAPEMYGVMTALLQAVTKNVVLSLEGGYNVNQTANGVLHCLRVLLGEDIPKIPRPVNAMSRGTEALLSEVKKIHGDQWKLLRGPTRRLAAPTAFPDKKATAGRSRKRRRGMPAWRIRDEIRRYKKRKLRHFRRVSRRHAIKRLIGRSRDRESVFLREDELDLPKTELRVPPPLPQTEQRVPPPFSQTVPPPPPPSSGSGVRRNE